jgi:hypothetical protein
VVFSQNWSITAESQHKTQVSESYRRTQPHISHSYTQTHRHTDTHTPTPSIIVLPVEVFRIAS